MRGDLIDTRTESSGVPHQPALRARTTSSRRSRSSNGPVPPLSHPVPRPRRSPRGRRGRAGLRERPREARVEAGGEEPDQTGARRVDEAEAGNDVGAHPALGVGLRRRRRAARRRRTRRRRAGAATKRRVLVGLEPAREARESPRLPEGPFCRETSGSYTGTRRRSARDEANRRSIVRIRRRPRCSAHRPVGAELLQARVRSPPVHRSRRAGRGRAESRRRRRHAARSPAVARS